MTETTKWAWSFKGEYFSGEFDTKEDAINAATKCPVKGVHKYYIGKIQEPEYFLGRYIEEIGEVICEHIEEHLSDCIASDDPIVQLTQEEKKTLGKIVIDYIKERDGFKSFNVDDIEEYEYECIN